MNCRKFNHYLPEYLDRTLKGRRLARAQEHFDRCPDCRLEVQRERAASGAISDALKRAADPLSLSTELVAQIIAASASPTNIPEQPAEIYFWPWFRAHPFRSIGAALAIVGLGLLSRKFSRDHTNQSFAATRHDSYVVDVPFRTEAHIFRLRNDTVVDSLVTLETESRANFTASSKPGLSLP